MYCNKCGTKIDDDAAFCTECGAPVAEDSDDKSQASVDPEPTPAPEPEPEPESAPAPEPATASEPEPEPPRRSRAPMVIIGVSGAVILVCLGILLAFTVFKPRTYAVNLPVSIPGLDEAGSRVPVQAHRVDVQTGPTVHVYLSSTGDGLELEPGTWEIKPEGSPIAKDGTIYQYEVEPVTMQVDKGEGDTVTARASEALELAPVSPAFVTDDQVSKAVKWAKGDKGRPASDTPAPSVDELAKSARTKSDEGAYDILLSKLKWVQCGNCSWNIDAGLSDLPLGGPVFSSNAGKKTYGSDAKLMYAIADINNDGTKELFLEPYTGTPSDSRSSIQEYMMAYTLVDGRLVCFDKEPYYFDGKHEWRAVADDGRIVRYFGGGSPGRLEFYELSDGQLVLRDSYVENDRVSTGATHNDEPISRQELLSATQYSVMQLDWKLVEDFSLSTPSPKDPGSFSDLETKRLKSVQDVMKILIPGSELAEDLGRRAGYASYASSSSSSDYASFFEQSALSSVRVTDAGNTTSNCSARFRRDALEGLFEGRDVQAWLRHMHGISVAVDYVGGGLYRVDISGTRDPGNGESRDSAPAAGISVLVAFEGDSTLIADTIPVGLW